MPKIYDKYKYGDEEIARERWGWQVRYRATDEQQAEAATRTVARAKELSQERDERERLMRERGGVSEETIANMRATFAAKLQIAEPPVQTIIKQFGDDRIYHRIGEIEQERVDVFSLYQLEHPEKRIDIIVPAEARLIHKYRNLKMWYKPTFEKVYLFGFKDKAGVLLHLVLPDDRIVTSTEETAKLDELGIVKAAPWHEDRL